MYICVCNAIRDCEIKLAARRCKGDAEAVYRALGKEVQCGMCLEDAADVIHEARNPVLEPHFI